MKSDININRMNEQVDEHAYVCIAVRSWSSGPSRLLVAWRDRLEVLWSKSPSGRL